MTYDSLASSDLLSLIIASGSSRKFCLGKGEGGVQTKEINISGGGGGVVRKKTVVGVFAGKNK